MHGPMNVKNSLKYFLKNIHNLGFVEKLFKAFWNFQSIRKHLVETKGLSKFRW